MRIALRVRPLETIMAASFSHRMDEMIRRLFRFHVCMHIKARGAGGAEDRLGASHFRWSAVRHHQKAIRFHGGLVLDHAVLRNADTIERCTKRAQPANPDSSLDGRG